MTMNMNSDRIEVNWKQLKSKTRQKWGKLTDDHLDVIKLKLPALPNEFLLSIKPLSYQ